MREVNCLTLSQILMTDLGCLEGITDMVGSIQEFLQRQLSQNYSKRLRVYTLHNKKEVTAD